MHTRWDKKHTDICRECYDALQDAQQEMEIDNSGG